MRKVTLFLLILLGLFSIVEPALACPTDPPPPSNNYKNCDDLGSGYQFGFKIAGARNGEYHFTSHYGTLTGGAPYDPNNYVRISDSNGHTFDWKASLGIDAVIVNAGGESKVKKLSPEATSGDNYYGAKDYWNRPKTIESVEFCYDYELGLKAEGDGTATTAAEWKIEKFVASPELTAFAGETANFDYTVAVAMISGSVNGANVVSTVVVKNNTPLKAKIKSVSATLKPWDKKLDLDCGVSFSYYLPAGKQLTCTATTSVPDKQDARVEVVVTTSGYVGGVSGHGHVEWTGDGSGGTSGPVTVTDTQPAFGGPYTTSESKTWNYTVPATCPSDPAAYTNGTYDLKLDNTATIVETNQTASQSAVLHCFAPVVGTTAQGGADTKYIWDITKTSPITELKLDLNQSGTADYEVGVSVLDKTVSNFTMGGTVVITNPHPTNPMTVTLTDEVAPGIPAKFSDCTNPITIQPATSVTCNYTPESQGQMTGVNTAQVTLNNIVFTATVGYDFTGTPANEVDECIEVMDDALSAPLGTVCANEAPKKFTYTLTIPGYAECGDTGFPNTAYFYTNDTQTMDYAVWNLKIHVRCNQLTDCTYTSTYWALHADPGDAASYNPTWDKVLPSGPSSPLLNTGRTWLGMLTDPTDSPYVNLAKEYVAANLNMLYGAKPVTNLQATVDHAGQLLTQYAGNEGGIVGTPAATDFSDTTQFLKNFNIGVTGPGLCPDCNQ